MKRLGDLDANAVIMKLVDEARRRMNNADPGSDEFAIRMASAAVLSSIAEALHEGFKNAKEST